MDSAREYQKKLEELARLKEEKRLRDELPHLHKFKDYKWSREFIESTDRMNILVSANQVAKSSTLIRKNILLATNKSLWPKFFPERTPTTFWYVYPDENKVNEEFDTKWMEFLPKGLSKDDSVYGWHTERQRNKIVLKFNSGVSIYFKTWSTDNQSGTVDMMSCDEELPEENYPELSMRISRYNGIFNMVFTATLNQPFWYQAIERIGHPDETFKHARKWQVSIPDHCRVYDDGTPSPWTEEKIQSQIQRCGTEKEILRRVYGRFITEEGTKYASFSREKNVKPPIVVPNDWLYYSGVDCGSGGNNHPAAISVIAVRPDYRYARLVRFWKGNKSERTTADDVLKQYMVLTEGLRLTSQYYDYSNADFKIISDRHGFNFQRANKDRGQDVLNVLFKNEMLDLEEGPHTDRLVVELMTLKETTSKTRAKDDGIDSLRYSTSFIPWDIPDIKTKELHRLLNTKPQLYIPTNDVSERGKEPKPSVENLWDFDKEVDEWNDFGEF